MNPKNKDPNKLFDLADKIRARMIEKEQAELEKIIDEEVKAVRALKVRKNRVTNFFNFLTATT